ncbi:MAG TPA: TonB-dependent siderophore receptor [Methylophilaceae bacterium]|jgi:catecholate siderophore receptor
MSAQSKFAKKRIAALVTLAFVPAQAWAEDAAVAQEIEALPEVNVVDSAIRDTGYMVERASSGKFTAPLIDTPKSVTVINEKVIKDTGATSFQDALRTTSGITFGTGEGGGAAFSDRPFIRGFDSQSSIFVDGLRDLGSQQRETFAVEQIEVLKGPSGAYEGRGSAGGSINIVTKKAQAGDFTNGSVSLGTDKYRRVTIDGNYQLGDNAAIRLVGMVHDADVPGRDSVDVKRWGFAPSLTLGLDTPTSATISWYHYETDDMPDRGHPYKDNTGATKSKPLRVDRDNFYGLKNRDYQETQADIGTFEIRHAFNDNVEIKNTLRYGETSNEYVTTRVLPNAADQAANRAPRQGQARKTETTSVANLTDLSFSFETGSIRHKVNTGVEFSREETDQFAATFLGGTGANQNGGPIGNLLNPDPNDPWLGSVSFSGRPTTTTKSVSKSVYVFDSMDLSEKWILNAGIRYDKFDVENNTAKTDHGFFNYQAGIVYKLQPNASIYASYATSSTPVGLGNGDGNHENGNVLDPTREDLKPERTRSFEIGTKWDVLEGLSLTAAAFHTVKTDARVLMADSHYENAGEFVINGFELGASGKITPKWDIFAGYTYLDSEQKKVGAWDGGYTDLGSAANKGNEMPGIAKNSLSIWTTYQLLPKLKVGGGAFYMDKVWANPGNDLYVPSYVRWDAMAAYEIDPRFSLQLNIQNLTDERYYNQTYTRHFASVAPGRLSFLTLDMKF